MFTTNAPGTLGTSIRPAVALDLEATDVVLVDERQETGVAVRADPLAGRDVAEPARVIGGRSHVADQLEQHLRRVDGCGEMVCGLPECERHGAQQRVTERLELFQPLGHHVSKFGERSRPQVGAAQPEPLGLVGSGESGGDLSADVDLVPEVDPSVGELVAESCVPAELGRVDVLDLQSVGFRKGEERAADVVDARRQVGIDAVPDDVEEPDRVHDLAEFIDERTSFGRRFVAAERFEVEQRQRERSACIDPI